MICPRCKKITLIKMAHVDKDKIIEKNYCEDCYYCWTTIIDTKRK